MTIKKQIYPQANIRKIKNKGYKYCINNKSPTVGDICEYSFYEDTDNDSCAIVKVVKVISPKVRRVIFIDTIRDDTGNGYFNYMVSSGEEMNVSARYLKPLCKRRR